MARLAPAPTTTMFERGVLFPSKIWFGAFYASLGFLMPVFNVLLAHIGYKAWQIGIISVLRPFVSAISGPIFAGLADSMSAHKTLFLATFACGALVRASIGIAAAPFSYLIVIITVMELVYGPVSALSDTAVMSVATHNGDYGACRFWASVSYNVFGILTSIAMTYVGDYAVFLGYAVMSAVAFIPASYLSFDKVTKPHAPHTEVVSTASSSIQSVSLDSPETSPETSAEELAVDAWNPYLTSHIICIHAEQSTPDYLAEPLLPIDPVDDSLKALDNMHLVHAQKVETFWQKLAWALHDPDMILFLCKGIVMGICVGVIDGYLFVYLDMLGAPPALFGACLFAIGCVELPVFTYSGEILDYVGYSGALHLALGAFCCRFVVYTTVHLMPTYWIVPPFEMLHGITFGIAWAAGVNYCKAKAPDGLKSAIQSLYGATYYGFGRGVGGLVGGLMLHRFGGPVLFGSVLIWTAACWALISIAELFITYSSSS